MDGTIRLADVVETGEHVAVVHTCGRDLSRYIPAWREDGWTVVLLEPAMSRDGTLKKKAFGTPSPIPYLRHTSRRRGRLHPVHHGFALRYAWACGCGAKGYRAAERMGNLPVKWDERQRAFVLTLD